MFSPHDSEAVLEELGDKFPAALVQATDAARADLQALRAWNPGWLSSMFQREVAGIVHSRLWAHLAGELEGVDGIVLRNEEPFREVRISTPAGRSYKARVKRHSEDGDRIRSYPTPSDLEFWGGAISTFEGLEDIPLAVGYRWQADTSEVGVPVISYREGKENVIWAVEVEAGVAGGVLPLQYTPIEPGLPHIDLAASNREEGSDGR